MGSLLVAAGAVALLVFWPLLMAASAGRRGDTAAEEWWASRHGRIAAGSLLLGAVLGAVAFDATSSGAAGMIWSLSGFLLVVLGSFAAVALVLAVPLGLFGLLGGGKDQSND